MTEPQRRRIINVVDNWKFWMTVFGFGLVAVIVALFVLYGRSARDEADRAAQQKSADVQTVAACFEGVKNAPVVAGFVDAHKALIQNGLDANRALLKIGGESPELTKVRTDSIARLEAAQTNVKILEALIATSTPTEKGCVKEAKELGVPFAIYLKQLHPPPVRAKPKTSSSSTTTSS